MKYDLEDDNCLIGDNFSRNISLFTLSFGIIIQVKNDEFVYIRNSFATDYDSQIKYNDFYSFKLDILILYNFILIKFLMGTKMRFILITVSIKWNKNQEEFDNMKIHPGQLFTIIIHFIVLIQMMDLVTIIIRR